MMGKGSGVYFGIVMKCLGKSTSRTHAALWGQRGVCPTIKGCYSLETLSKVKTPETRGQGPQRRWWEGRVTFLYCLSTISEISSSN